MGIHNAIFLGLLVVLFFFKKPQYAAGVMLISLGVYVRTHSVMFDEYKDYYFLSCAARDTAVAIALLKYHHFKTKSDVLNWRKYNVNQFISIIFISLVCVSFFGYIYRRDDVTRELLDIAYISIYSFAIFLLYVGTFEYVRNGIKRIWFFFFNMCNRKGNLVNNKKSKGI